MNFSGKICHKCLSKSSPQYRFSILFFIVILMLLVATGYVWGQDFKLRDDLDLFFPSLIDRTSTVFKEIPKDTMESQDFKFRDDVFQKYLSDVRAPSVTSFKTLSSSTSLNIQIASFTADDNIGVASFMITTTVTPPLPGDAGWMPAVPETYAVDSDGMYTLYPWVKDASGNISAVYELPPTVIVDSTPPTVRSTKPSHGETNVNVGFTVIIEWSEAINCSTVNTTTITSGIPGWTLSSCFDRQAVFTSSRKNYSTPYDVTITSSVTDVAGNPMPSAYQMSIITEETPYTQPQIKVYDKHIPEESGIVTAVKVSTDAILMDGKLNEEIWQTASPATGFLQFEPLSGSHASEKTEVRVLYDEVNLYIGATLYDSYPEGIIADEMRMGADLDRNDNFMIIVDTFHDHRNGFFFKTNPLGTKVEALAFDEGKHVNYNWEGVWWSEATQTSEGWQVEMKIPFSTLRFNNEKDQTWGVNFGRYIRRKNEYVYWSYVPLDASQWRVSLAGHLDGIEKVRQGKNLHIKPYLSVKQLEEKNISGRKNNSILLDTGADVKYLISPNLTADLTLNPDFSQVEADELMINVTRFPLFFPEKREFFLEGSGYFDFGLYSKIQPFHSRRIGIAKGREIPIYGGGKLSGKAGNYSIGFLSLETKDKDEEPQTNYSLLRLKRNIQERSYFGIIAVNMEPKDVEYNRTFGADLFLSLFDHLYVNSFIMETDTEGMSGEDGAGYISIAWDDPKKYLNLSYLDIDDRFNGIRFEYIIS
jgi:hypothetical protein